MITRIKLVTPLTKELYFDPLIKGHVNPYVHSQNINDGAGDHLDVAINPYTGLLEITGDANAFMGTHHSDPVDLCNALFPILRSKITQLPDPDAFTIAEITFHVDFIQLNNVYDAFTCNTLFEALLEASGLDPNPIPARVRVSTELKSAYVPGAAFTIAVERPIRGQSILPLTINVFDLTNLRVNDSRSLLFPVSSGNRFPEIDLNRFPAIYVRRLLADKGIYTFDGLSNKSFQVQNDPVATPQPQETTSEIPLPTPAGNIVKCDICEKTITDYDHDLLHMSGVWRGKINRHLHICGDCFLAAGVTVPNFDHVFTPIALSC